MKTPRRVTDKNSTKVFRRTERLFTDGMDYYYKIRNGGISTSFDTRAEALYDLRNFIIALSIENELRGNRNILTN